MAGSLGTEGPALVNLDAPFHVPYLHRLISMRGAFETGDELAGVLEPTDDAGARVLVMVDSGVSAAWPGLAASIDSLVQRHAGRLRVTGAPVVVPGGERIKNEPPLLQQVLRAIDDAGLCRRSYVLAIGGGAMLDAVGFAAAIAHRGVRLVRMPTTTLSQCDSGVGVKNGVNLFGKKNYMGCFAPPWAVINDSALLTTLSSRDWRCGFSEAVKVALLKDAAFFDQIERDAARICARDMDASVPILDRSAELHLRHITDGGDPFETTLARPLDYGHWAAHRLEEMSGYDVRHGEAVALGLALDVMYAREIGEMAESLARRVLSCLDALGFELFHPLMGDGEALLVGLDEFREHLGGPLTVTLVREVGSAFDVHEVDRGAMLRALRALESRWSGRGGASGGVA